MTTAHYLAGENGIGIIGRRKLLHAAAPQVNIPRQGNGDRRRKQIFILIALNAVYPADRAVGVQRQGQLGRIRRGI